MPTVALPQRSDCFAELTGQPSGLRQVGQQPKIALADHTCPPPAMVPQRLLTQSLLARPLLPIETGPRRGGPVRLRSGVGRPERSG
jgi:hypothetical protein